MAQDTDDLGVYSVGTWRECVFLLLGEVFSLSLYWLDPWLVDDVAEVSVSLLTFCLVVLSTVDMVGLRSAILFYVCSLCFCFSVYFSLPPCGLLELFFFFRIAFWFIYSIFECISLYCFLNGFSRHYIIYAYHSILMSFYQFQWSIETSPIFMFVTLPHL